MSYRALNDLTEQIDILELDKASASYAVQNKYLDSYLLFYEYQDALRHHTRDILTWQIRSSYVVLVLVVLVTCLGISLSFWEVTRSVNAPTEILQRLSSADNNEATEQRQQQPTTTLEISAQKLQVTSAVTGVIILVISLAFLYLFVHRVLELKPVELTAVHEPADSGEDNP